jgi:hypothetical protein
MPSNMSSKTLNGVIIVWLDKRRKPASITATAKPTNDFPPIYEKGTCILRLAVTGELLLTYLLSQLPGALVIGLVKK